MTGPPSIWTRLGLKRTRERAAIRRAYAVRLRDTHPEDDPEGFAALRQAYEAALVYAEQGYDFEAMIRGETFSDDAPDDSDQDPADDDGPSAPAPDPHAAARRSLAALLAPNAGATPEALLDALHDVIGGAALDDVGHYARTEVWLAELILRSAPRADGLIQSAVVRFGWDDAPRRARAPPAILAVVARWDGLRRIERMQSAASADFDLWRTLKRGPSRYLAWRMLLDNVKPVELRRLLDDLEGAGLADQLPPGMSEAWRAWFERPHLSPAAVVTAAIAGPLLSAGLLLSGAIDYKDAGLALGVGFGAGVGGVAFTVWGLGDLRRRWLEGWSWRAPTWVHIGWAPASLALLAAACLGGGPIAAGAIAAVGLALVLWAYVTREPVPMSGGQARYVARLVASNALLVAWWALSLDSFEPTLTLAVCLAFATVIAVTGLGEASLVGFWYGRTSIVIRRALLALMLASAVGAFAGVLVAWPDPRQNTWAAAAVVAAVATQRLPGVGVSQWMSGPFSIIWRLGVPAMFFGRFLYQTTDESLTPLLYSAGGLVLSAASALAYGVALVSELRAKA